MQRKCPYCGAYLDTGEACGCDAMEQPEREEAHRCSHRVRAGRDAAHTQDEYIQRRWQRWDEA